MSKSLLPAALAAGLLATIPLPAAAHSFTLGALKIGHPWSRPTPPGAPAAAGYLTVTNTGAEPDRLVGAASPVAAKVELHQMSITDGVMRMRPVEGGLPVAPGQTLTLQPGGYHLMLIGPKAPLKVGDRIPATLRFARAGEVKVEFLVQAAPPEGAGHAGHMGAH